MLRTLSQFHGTHLSLDWHLLLVLHRVFGSWHCIRAGHVSYLEALFLSNYPSIETCLVALSAYTCYFFSNGMSMSGIVLRHHFEALRVSHHVPKDTTRHEIHFFRSLTAFREFHLHLPRIVAIHEPAKFREGHYRN